MIPKQRLFRNKLDAFTMRARYLFAAIVTLSGVSAHPTVDLERRSPTGYNAWPPPSP